MFLEPLSLAENPPARMGDYEAQIWCECGNDKWVYGQIQLNVETGECPPMVKNCYRCSLCDSVRLEYRRDKTSNM